MAPVSIAFSKRQVKPDPVSEPLKQDGYASKNAEDLDNGPDYENTAFIGECHACMSVYNTLLCDDVDIYRTVKGHLKPIPVDEFGDHVARMHADRDKCFELEYNVSWSGSFDMQSVCSINAIFLVWSLVNGTLA